MAYVPSGIQRFGTILVANIQNIWFGFRSFNLQLTAVERHSDELVARDFCGDVLMRFWTNDANYQDIYEGISTFLHGNYY